MNIIEKVFNDLKAEGVIESDAELLVYGPDEELINHTIPDSCQYLKEKIKQLRKQYE